EDKHGSLWIAANRTGVIIFNPYSDTFEFLPGVINQLKDISVRRIFIAEEGNIFFGTQKGGLYILSVDGSFTQLMNTDKPRSLNDNSIWSIYKDAKGILWAGTESGGINTFDRYRTKCVDYHSYSENIRKERVLSFCEAAESILIGTDGGRMSLDPAGNL